MQCDACTYSLLRSTRTSVRTTLAMLIQLVSPMTIDRLSALALPRIACSSTISSRFGMLMKISLTRMKNASSFSPAQPLRLPKKTAMAVDSSVAQMPMNSDSLPPDQIIEKISRPIVSVPKRNSLFGAALQWLRSI